MALTDDERLRSLLGESVPTDGTDEDTMFSNAEITDLLQRSDNVDDALAEGWKIKAGRLSTLVDTVEGASRRAMSDAHLHAMKMVEFYTTKDPARVRTRIRKITRR